MVPLKAAILFTEDSGPLNMNVSCCACYAASTALMLAGDGVRARISRVLSAAGV